MAQPARGPWCQLDLGPLHEANFRRYYIGQALSGFGDSLVPLALAFVVLDLTGSMAALGLVLLASRVPSRSSRWSAGCWGTGCAAVTS